MKVKRQLLYSFFAAAILLGCAACGKDDGSGDNPGTGGGTGDPDTETSVINGTTIKDGNNLVGLISNSSTGKGIEGVPVTDGFTYTETDANGVYQMEANRYCRKVYYSIPAEYKINVNSASHLPEFFSTKIIDRYAVNRTDFKLTPLSTPEENFSLVMIGDPQCQTAAQANRYVTETIPDIQSSVNTILSESSSANVYAITLGDIVFDSSSLWDTMKNSMSNVKLANGNYLSFFNCIGNHDHYSQTSSDFAATEKFVNYFGPTDYSFNRGKVHIIVMDDVMAYSTTVNSSPDKATWNYYGGFTASQYKWLQEDLSYVDDKENKMVIFCAHIPFRGGGTSSGASVNTDKYYSEVLTLLKGFKEAHIMIGHTHYTQNYIHSGYVCKGGQPIYEHVHGAACGSWWSSNSDVIGGPNGYNVYSVQGASINNWYVKGTNRAQDFQLRVYNGDQEYTGSKNYAYTWYGGGKGGSSSITAKGNSALKNCFVAQVWGDDDTNWKVEFYQNGVKTGNFTRLPNRACTNVCFSAYTFNELAKNTSTWTSTTASHYWYFKPTSGDPGSETKWEVRATQTIPASSATNVYNCTEFTTDYSSF